MQKNNYGFTLIELLAVVLIIGLLASLALPQYRRSVARAEATDAMVNLKTIFDSAKRYRAATSSAPVKLQGLDISFFDASSDTASTFSIGKFQYTFDPTYVASCRLNGNYCFRFYYNHPTQGRDTLTCLLTSTEGKYSWLCESLGTTEINTNEYLIEG